MAKKGPIRRSPTQKRAQVTVEAMLDAAIRLLKKSGTASITTNSIAETAGVSIGSVYQYFPNKRAIFIALHERHIAQVDSIIERCLTANIDATLEGLLSSIIDGIVVVHAADPELSELLHSEVPHRAADTPDFSVRLHSMFRDALAPHMRRSHRNLDLRTFVVTNMIDAVGHAMVLRRPAGYRLHERRQNCFRQFSLILGPEHGNGERGQQFAEGAGANTGIRLSRSFIPFIRGYGLAGAENRRPFSFSLPRQACDGKVGSKRSDLFTSLLIV